MSPIWTGVLLCLTEIRPFTSTWARLGQLVGVPQIFIVSQVVLFVSRLGSSSAYFNVWLFCRLTGWSYSWKYGNMPVSIFAVGCRIFVQCCCFRLIFLNEIGLSYQGASVFDFISTISPLSSVIA